MMAALAALTLSSCTDWLTEPSPGVTKVEDFYTTEEAALQNVNAAYVPLMWEYNTTYFSEWFIGDIVSDDALKGGQTTQGDMGDVYDMENWRTISTNTVLLEYYRAKYQGVQRCNLVLHYVPSMKDSLFSVDGLKQRILGEAYFLRAIYYFQLVRVYGGVPLVTDIIEKQENWQQPRATADQVYDQIISDLLNANSRLWLKDKYATDNLGRATKGAAQAMLLKVYLYRGNYQEARAWGDSVIASGKYKLIDDYAENFRLSGENNDESVFEIQYREDPTSDYGEGYGFTRGTFTTILTRSRSEKKFGSNTGWGFNKPTKNLYKEFEEGDPRRDITILEVDSTTEMSNKTEEIYLGSPYCSRKYALYKDDNSGVDYVLSHDSRGPLNYKVIRYSDVLLMYAEACEQAGPGEQKSAEEALEEVRARARKNAADPSTALPAYPNYTISINGTTIQPSLQQAIRHERRVELAMEGHRWFDICRWKGFDGTGVKAHMDAYKATESEAAQKAMSEFKAGTHELFPIPADEITLNPMEQNPGY